jgi:hypothetical protein
MRPTPDKVLAGVATALFMDITPDVRTPFGQSAAGMAGTLTLVLAQEVDRLVDRLHSEATAIAALLMDARELLLPPDQDVVDAAMQALPPPDLKVSTMQAANDRLRAALITVHAAVEALDSAEARAMNARIWEELKESTRRRHVEVPR